MTRNSRASSDAMSGRVPSCARHLRLRRADSRAAIDPAEVTLPGAGSLPTAEPSQPLKPAVEMIDAVDDRPAFGGERRDHERDRRAQIGRHHLARPSRRRRRWAWFASSAMRGAEPHQLLHVHEAVLEDGLATARCRARAIRRHQLRLQDRSGSPVRRGGTSTGADAEPLRATRTPSIGRAVMSSGLASRRARSAG